MDPYKLSRFVAAQTDCYAEALQELRVGEKRTHWMWFIFPQYEGLGFSTTARRYAIKSMDEARAYLAHPVLGPRLFECAKAVNEVEGRSARQIFGTPDDLKFCSSMTLFERASAQPGGEFSRALKKYYADRRDERTLALLEAPAP